MLETCSGRRALPPLLGIGTFGRICGSSDPAWSGGGELLAGDGTKHAWVAQCARGSLSVRWSSVSTTSTSCLFVNRLINHQWVILSARLRHLRTCAAPQKRLYSRDEANISAEGYCNRTTSGQKVDGIRTGRLIHGMQSRRRPPSLHCATIILIKHTSLRLQWLARLQDIQHASPLGITQIPPRMHRALRASLHANIARQHFPRLSAI